MRSTAIPVALLTSVLLTLTLPAFAVPIYNTNLILNGNAETGAGSPTGDVVLVPNWTTTSNFTSVAYGAPSGFPASNSPGPTSRGNNLFAGGPSNASSSASQTNPINLSSAITSINTGKIAYDLSGWFGGFATQDDNATLTATFLNSNNGVLRTDTIGGVRAVDRNNITSLLFREDKGIVPIGTTSVGISLSMARAFGVYNDAYADNLSFIISPVPEPATSALMMAGLAFLSWTIARRKKIAQF